MRKTTGGKYGWVVNKPIGNSYAIMALIAIVAIASAATIITLSPKVIEPQVLGITSGADTYYVNQVSGNPANPGTEAAPFKTIQQAVAVAGAGDTILVAPGNYTSTTVSSKTVVNKSGQSGLPITLKATGAGVLTNGFTLSNANYIIIDGFDITTPLNSTWFYEEYGSGIYLNQSNNCEIKNNIIHNTSYPGILLQSGSSNNVVSHNTITAAGTFAGIMIDSLTGINDVIEYNDISATNWNPLNKSLTALNNLDADADGIKLEGKGHIIRNNYIHDLRSPGTGTGDGSGRPHTDAFQIWNTGVNITFENNIVIIPNNDGVVQAAEIENASDVSNITFKNNVFSGLFRGLNVWGINGKSTNGVYIYNNTFNNIIDYGLELYNINTAEVKNNIFNNVGADKCSGAGAYLANQNGTINAVFANNDYYLPTKTPTKTTQLNSGCSKNASDLIQINPLFVNTIVNDFHLQSASTLIDQGMVIASVTADLDGTARPQSAGYDMGAYEYISKIVPIPAPTSTVPTSTATSTIPTSTQPVITPTSTVSTSTPTSTVVVPAVGTGLLGQYFNEKNFTALKITRVDPTINFNWGKSAPGGMGTDRFSVRWLGQVAIDQAGLYSFYLKSDDGGRLWIDGKLVINRWVNQRATEYRVDLILEKGLHNIKIEYFENTGNAVAVLSWKGPGFVKRVIPAQKLYPANQ
ncbi:MAG: PA14 domain-containing protein [Candidatus Buchananbacteria bacterium]